MLYSLLDENDHLSPIGVHSKTREQAIRLGLDYLCVAILSGRERVEARSAMSKGNVDEMERVLKGHDWRVYEHEYSPYGDVHEAEETSVNLPNAFSDDIRETEWVNVKTFPNREAAIRWAQENLGADQYGRILVVAGSKPGAEK